MSLSVLSRRDLVVGASCLLASTSRVGATGRRRAIAFDAFPLFDPRSIAVAVKARVPEKGEALANLWTSKLFASTWIEIAAGRYQPFRSLAASTLRSSADSLGIALADGDRDELVAGYARLEVWPDVKVGLDKLRSSGVRLAVLSNLGEESLRSNLERSGIAEAFEAVLSTDRVQRFKPSPMAYAMATEAFSLPASAIGFAAFGGWDAVGATWFGYETAWINRAGVPAEPFVERPAIVTRGFEGVLQLAGVT